MTRTSRHAPTVEPQPTHLAAAQIRAAIPRLERRLQDFEGFQVDAISSGRAPEIATLEHATKTTIGQIFGAESLEYSRFKDLFWGLGMFGDPDIRMLRSDLAETREKGIALLKSQIQLLKEQLGEDGDTKADRAIRAYGNLDLHREIARVASQRYLDGHYADAIESAMKQLAALVQYRSGETIDGTALMTKVFSANAPILRVNEGTDQSDKDEQLGIMNLFSGAVSAFRNPRAHKIIEDDPERALEVIAFISLLAKITDEAKK